MLNHTIYLDVVPGGVPPIVHVSQFDEGSRTLLINLYAGVGELTIPDGATVKIRGTKPDRKGFEYTATLNGTTAIFDVTRNMTAVAGRVYCEVAIVSEEEELMTATFILMVKRSAFGEDVDIGASDLPDFYELAQQIAEDAQEAANSAQAAAESAAQAWETTPEGYEQMIQDLESLEEDVQEQESVVDEMRKSSYFGWNRPVKKDVYRKRLALEILSGDENHATLQGGCYLPATGHFLMAIINGDEDSAVLVEVDTDYETVIRRVSLDLGHANDLAYNPNTNKIYVATGSTGANANTIAVLNGTSLALEETITLGDTKSKWLCSYDEVNDRYYVLDNQDLRVYNGSWSLLKTFSNIYKDQYEGECVMTAQSSFCYQGNFIGLYFAREMTNGSQRVSAIYLQMVDYDTGEVQTVAQYSPRGNADEPEFVALIRDIGYMFGGQTYLSVSELYFDQTKLYDAGNSIFGVNTLLAADADLNDYQMPGTYYSPNTAYTTGITNAPTTTGFTLYVIPVSGNVIVQKMINSAGNLYKRVLSSTTNAWLPWEMLDSSIGERYRRDGQATTHTVEINDDGAWLVMFPLGTGVNMYLISESAGTTYCRPVIEGISGATINTTIGNSAVTFRCSMAMGMMAWRLA